MSKTATVTPTNGLAGDTTYTLTIKGGSIKDLAGNALTTDKTVTFTTAVARYSLWYPATQNVNNATGDPSVELGTKFSTSKNGTISAIAFYKAVGDPATSHTVTLWDANGNALATTTTSTETASGWQTATFASPVSVSSGNTYTASYRSVNGAYAYSSGNLTSPYSYGALTVPVNGGVFNYNSGVPVQSFGGANYWVDVIFTEN
jgi:hypothetical protein